MTRKEAIEKKRSRAYWNCRLSSLEKRLFVAALGVTFALHLTPVQKAGIGNPLLVLLAAICCCSSFTGFFLIGCCSVLPFGDAAINEIIRTEGFNSGPVNAITPAKIAIIVWALVTVFRYKRFNLDGVKELWPVMPWLILLMALTGEFIFKPTSEYMKALLFSVMACQFANDAKGEYLKCLMGLCLGALIVLLAYWGAVLGFPIQLSDYGSERAGVKRVGGVRADSVMVWPAILMGIAGVIGLSLILGSRINKLKLPRWYFIAAGVLFVASIPPLVATMTHSGYAGMALLLVGALAVLFYTSNRGILTKKQISYIVSGSVALVVLFSALYSTNTLDLKIRTHAILLNYEDQSEEMGVAASRTGVWGNSIHTILKYPLLGVSGAGASEEITTGYAERGYYLSHNVFLDYGRFIGIPGMLLLVWFFFYPLIKIYQSGRWLRYIPFVFVHFSMFIFWVSLSFPFYKTFWGLWMLMILAVLRMPRN